MMNDLNDRPAFGRKSPNCNRNSPSADRSTSQTVANGSATARMPVRTSPLPSERPAAEKPVADRLIVEQMLTVRLDAEKPVAEKTLSVRSGAEERGTQNPVAEKPVAEKQVAEKHVAEKQAAENAVGGKPTATNGMSPPEPTAKKLLRGISRATDNVNLVSKVRSEIAHDFQQNKKHDCLKDNGASLLDVPDHTFILPDISIHSDDFRDFLEKDLIEKSTLISLKNAGRLNWWFDQLSIAQQLWPLATTGDGNCLLHAASLGMWGFHDRLLTLRKALHYFMINHSAQGSSFYRRWRYQCTLQNRQAGLILCEEEWLNEWTGLLKMASTEPRVRGCGGGGGKRVEINGGKKDSSPEDELQNHVYESLEEIHILALAHVLKRPIIVIADTMLKDVTGEPFAPIPFGGIYLPLQCNPSECHKAPLCLTYDAAHFSALVAMDSESFADRTPNLPVAIPLMDSDGQLLPLQFSVEPDIEVDWAALEAEKPVGEMVFGEAPKPVADNNRLNVLRSYLDIIYLDKKTRQPVELSSGQQAGKVRADSRTESAEHNSIRSEIKSTNGLPKQVETKPITDTVASHDPIERKTSAEVDSEPASEKRIGRVANQLNSISRGFGTLRRTMSKRIKRNLGNFSRKNGTKETSSEDCVDAVQPPVGANIGSASEAFADSRLEEPPLPDNLLVAAVLHTDRRPDYHEQMIRNYLRTARLRFLNQPKERPPAPSEATPASRCSSSASSHCSSLSGSAKGSSASGDGEAGFATPCVNPGCKNFGTCTTNYLCALCFSSQQKEMLELKAADPVSSGYTSISV